MDNTPTIDGGYDNIPITIYEEAKKEYDRFMKNILIVQLLNLLNILLKTIKMRISMSLLKVKYLKIWERWKYRCYIRKFRKNDCNKRNYENYILADNNWIADLSEGYIYSGEKEYPIQIIGISSLKGDGSETWTWAWEYSD